jgi:hypothetical protein
MAHHRKRRTFISAHYNAGLALKESIVNHALCYWAYCTNQESKDRVSLLAVVLPREEPDMHIAEGCHWAVLCPNYSYSSSS